MKLKPWMKISLLLGLLATGAVIYVLVPPDPTPAGTQSRTYYQPGELGFVERPFNVIDESRPTSANNDFGGADQRILEGRIWFPSNRSAGPYPLVAYSHGFMSWHKEAESLAEFLVPRGYVIVSVNYPLTNYFAPGGPNVRDVINQPEDISFVIDQILRRNAQPNHELFGLVDPDRIAAAGLSLGGLTSTLAAYHKHRRDSRLKAAVSIAGPSAFFGSRFYETSAMPFMMVAADADAIVPYGTNATPILERNPGSLLATIKNGSHTGFAGGMAAVFRWVKNPDEMGCAALMSNLPEDPVRAEGLLSTNNDIGILPGLTSLPCQVDDFKRSMRPAEQIMLTRLIIFSFLESVFATEASQRQRMLEFLVGGLPTENPDVIVEYN
jgi:dienelactone hydrolase